TTEVTAETFVTETEVATPGAWSRQSVALAEPSLVPAVAPAPSARQVRARPIAAPASRVRSRLSERRCRRASAPQTLTAPAPCRKTGVSSCRTRSEQRSQATPKARRRRHRRAQRGKE